MCVLRILFVFAFLFGVSSFNFPYDYHMEVGVPKAAALKSLESARIVGGAQVASPSVIPHHAGIIITLTTGWTSICGGSLISNNRVLTAARCWWDGRHQSRHFTVVLGSVTLFSGGVRIETSDVVVHGNFNPSSILHDIAVVRITNVSYNNNIQAVPLPGMGDVNRDLVGLTAVVSGFGKTTDAQTSIPASTALNQASVVVISNAACQSNFTVDIHGSMLCTSGVGSRGVCDGDEGSPLTVVLNNQRVQIGVVSFSSSQGCEFGFPSVYTGVTAFINWINSHMTLKL